MITVKLSTLKRLFLSLNIETEEWGTGDARDAVERLPTADLKSFPLKSNQRKLIENLIAEAEGDNEFTILNE